MQASPMSVLGAHDEVFEKELGLPHFYSWTSQVETSIPLRLFPETKICLELLPTQKVLEFTGRPACTIIAQLTLGELSARPRES